MSRHKLLLYVPLAGALALAGTAAAQTSASAVAGYNLNAPPSQDPIFVDWNQPSASWMLQVDLIFDPSAGPMEKHFESPRGATGGPILLDALQPFPQVLWEDFLILPPPGGTGYPVLDWHQEIHTPGWQWVVPGDPRFPGLFPANATLITKNGLPWPSTPTPMDPPDPTKVWVEFDPILPGEVLDVHKALLWVGTDGNRIWGDMADDAGVEVDESFIAVWEYPTGIPEPSTIVLLALGIVCLWLKRPR